VEGSRFLAIAGVGSPLLPLPSPLSATPLSAAPLLFTLPPRFSPLASPLPNFPRALGLTWYCLNVTGDGLALACTDSNWGLPCSDSVTLGASVLLAAAAAAVLRTEAPPESECGGSGRSESVEAQEEGECGGSEGVRVWRLRRSESVEAQEEGECGGSGGGRVWRLRRRESVEAQEEGECGGSEGVRVWRLRRRESVEAQEEGECGGSEGVRVWRGPSILSRSAASGRGTRPVGPLSARG